MKAYLMKILVLAPDYPKPGRRFGGIFNERSVAALRERCEDIQVLVPRPYAPPLLSSFVSRWRIHATTPAFELKNAVPVYRPAIPIIPGVASAYWVDRGAFVFCRSLARKLHRRTRFDAILSFDLLGTGGLAWRMGRDLGIPAIGWATGDDVKISSFHTYRKAVTRAIRNLDLIFYQSHELIEKAFNLLNASGSEWRRDRHQVLPRGISHPPLCLPKNAIRQRLRKELGIVDDQVLVINIGRICREKGLFELIESISIAVRGDSRISCVLVGSSPAHDDTAQLAKALSMRFELKDKVKILPACDPDTVWEYLCAADIFAFTSYKEGMPNSLLEAMAMAVPSIAFAIPAILEIECGTGALLLVPPFDAKLFSEALLNLAASSSDRTRVGELGQRRVYKQYMTKTNMSLALERICELTRIT